MKSMLKFLGSSLLVVMLLSACGGKDFRNLPGNWVAISVSSGGKKQAFDTKEALIIAEITETEISVTDYISDRIVIPRMEYVRKGNRLTMKVDERLYTDVIELEKDRLVLRFGNGVYEFRRANKEEEQFFQQ